MVRKALGRGLEALIPAASEPAEGAATGTPRELPVGDVGPSPYQPRTRFDDAALQELAASIKASGVLQPVIVRRHADGYQLVAGERRLRAAQLAGLDQIPAIIRDVDDREMMELALIENIQREDLTPIDEAKAYKALLSAVGLTHDQLSERVGKQRSSITNSLRLLGLPPEVQDMVSRGTLSAGHARALLGLEASGDQLAAARYVVAKGFSVRRTEAFVTRRLRRQKSKPRVAKAGELAEWESKLQQRFATRVTIIKGRKGGRVEFEYYGDTDLERLFEAWGVM
ncbi:MAG TPA: ParB/RepB/Spo0J family partition protein [Candidatus Eisenbacteria bacterium]|nr:ParB/RepB/Spo0J family partition protein [Candidatus Eisenbacteria bacterium]